MGWLIHFARKDWASAWDNVKVIVGLLEPGNKLFLAIKSQYFNIFPFSAPTKTKKRRKAVKFSATFNLWLQLTKLLFAFAPHLMFFATIFIILLKLDPYIYLLQEFLPQVASHHYFLCGILRFLVTLVDLFVFFRLLLLLAVCANGLLCITKKRSTATFLKAKLPTSHLLKIYGCLRVLLGSSDSFVNPFMAAGLFMLQISGIGGFFSTIEMRPPIIPIPIYFVCPCFGGGALLIFFVLFTPICHGYEAFRYFLKEMQLKPGEAMAGKLVAKQVRAMRIISVSPGLADYRFFPLKRCTKATFLEYMITFVITLLMRPKGNATKYNT